MKNRIRAELSAAASQVGKAGVVFWNITRLLLISGLFLPGSAMEKAFISGALLMCCAVSLCRIAFGNKGFFGSLSYSLQTVLCVTAFFSAVLGKIAGLGDAFTEYDIFLHLLAGAAGVSIGYYVCTALSKPETGREYAFASFFSLAFSATVACVREIIEFLTDFQLGTNLMKMDVADDSHWFYRLFGKGMTELIPNQQRILDTDEDMLLAVLSAFVAAGVLYIYLRIKNKSLFKKERTKNKTGLINSIGRKITEEKQKINTDCNICDVLFWWVVRMEMLYAAFNMVTAEAILLSVNMLGTFSVSALHMLTPSGSVLNKLSYRVQTVITAIVFLGSYCGNYIFVYGIYSRYDLFLHFISGGMSVMAGYYLAKTFFTVSDKKQATLTCLFALCFSGMVIPCHEIVEFIGDFIWGTTNQGFNWGPSDNSFFFRIFGTGAGNTQLYYVFDTMYDMLLASSMAIGSSAALYLYLRVKLFRQAEKSKNEQTAQIKKEKLFLS